MSNEVTTLSLVDIDGMKVTLGRLIDDAEASSTSQLITSRHTLRSPLLRDPEQLKLLRAHLVAIVTDSDVPMRVSLVSTHAPETAELTIQPCT